MTTEQSALSLLLSGINKISFRDSQIKHTIENTMRGSCWFAEFNSTNERRKRRFLRGYCGPCEEEEEEEEEIEEEDGEEEEVVEDRGEGEEEEGVNKTAE